MNVRIRRDLPPESVNKKVVTAKMKSEKIEDKMVKANGTAKKVHLEAAEVHVEAAEVHIEAADIHLDAVKNGK